MTTGPASEDGTRLGAWLRQARAAAGMTQEELAERSGVGVRTIGDLERGRTRKPYARSIRCLATALGAPFPGLASGVLGAVAGSGPADSSGDRPARPVPRLLPAGTASFTGRQGEVGMLLELAVGASMDPRVGVVMISAIDGMAGIGKTTLAIHAAQLMAERFPDGQLFVDLHGYTPGREPMTTGDALNWFLRCLGISPQLVPQDLDARAAFYRNRLASTQTLIVLDNAYSTAQIRPLIPGAAGCLVLVTSRKRLTGLDDVQALPLDVLSELEATALFHTIAGPGRVAAGHPAVARVVALCGYLPLAIRIAAARLRYHPRLTVDRLCAELDQEHQRLSRLADDDRNLTMAFDLSHARLPPAGQAMFRTLGLVPGPEVDAYAAAALTGVSLETAESLLESLLDHNLLLQVTQGRFRFHDLLKLHARTHIDAELPAAERDQAIDRLLDYYLHTAQQANIHLARFTPAYAQAVTHPPRQIPELTSQEQAMAWIRAELPNLTAAIQMAATTGHTAYTVSLPAALAAYLDTAGPYEQARILHSNAAETAATLDDHGGQAEALDNLGRARWRTGDYPGAAAACQQALHLYTALGDRSGQASALNNLGIVWYLTGDLPRAAAACQQALHLYTALGGRRGQASALNNLGIVQRLTGDYPGAVAACHQALDLYTALGDRWGQAAALDNLGNALWWTGDLPGATSAFQGSMDLFVVLGDRRGQASVLTNLGLVQMLTGDLPGATAAEQQALDLYTALGDCWGQAAAFDNRGVVLLHAADYPAATTACQQSLDLFRKLGDRRSEAEVLNHYGAVLTAAGQPGQARLYHLAALALARRIESAPEEAQALEGIGEADLAENSAADGINHLRQALALSRRLGVPAADRIQARLAALGGS